MVTGYFAPLGTNLSMPQRLRCAPARTHLTRPNTRLLNRSTNSARDVPLSGRLVDHRNDGRRPAARGGRLTSFQQMAVGQRPRDSVLQLLQVSARDQVDLSPVSAFGEAPDQLQVLTLVINSSLTRGSVCARGDLNRARPTLILPELASLSVK